MANAKGKQWKMERASVTARGKSRSNKYARFDNDKQPPAHARTRVWVGGYTRSDGTRVHGHYRSTPGV